MKFYEDGNIPEIPNMYFIYGDGGTGKTSLLKQLKGHKFVFSFDMSSNVLIGDKDVDVVIFEHNDAPNIQAMVEECIIRAIQNAKYQVIVLDNVTALQNLVLENIDNAAKDNRQNYQKLQLWFRDLGTILKESGKTIYATAHQLDNGSSGISGEGRFQADMNEKTFNAFTSMFDLVGRIYLAAGERMIDLDPEKGNHAKNRLDDRKLIKANELIQSEKGEK
ncbi:AAA family ATPase [Lactiplantibacillus plantarum]|uniref:Prophage P2a protein 17 n=2 Tax=Lactiplantibacillus plantarum TaxID=1590 RepID=F9UQX9_LACPL|nr:AAA family ATPase [Lactiplantibacillus plantarum]KZU55128.1 prophage Lp2 protein 17 [Lactiplantibacillus plantarum]MBO2723381.1 AAA family ATPase [Lactiplantibacillus plantarum]MCG0820929.1 prophage P2a protein 17 [Lactiplantibacillus plantarum]MCG0880332.1 prophage P2a protein 17 [Lactiplantibacillus plantarum]MDE4416113.1 nucleotide-binding protein [Lactiplantibacillus plantarum]